MTRDHVRASPAALMLLVVLAALPPQVLAATFADWDHTLIQVTSPTTDEVVAEADAVAYSYDDGSIELSIQYDVNGTDDWLRVELIPLYSGEPGERGIWKLEVFDSLVKQGGRPYIDYEDEDDDYWEIKWEFFPEFPEGTIYMKFVLEDSSYLTSDLTVSVILTLAHVTKIGTLGEKGKLYLDFNPDSGGSGGCPTLFVWNGTGFVKDELINIHAEEDIVRAVTLNAGPALVNNSFYVLKLSEVAEGFNYSASHIDCVRLVALVERGNGPGRVECELVRAEHSSLGIVTRELKRSDDVRVTTVKGEEVVLTFRAPKGHGKVEALILCVEGHNPVKV